MEQHSRSPRTDMGGSPNFVSLLAYSAQFGFTGGDEWETRRDALVNTLTTNPTAMFVTRGVQFGSEPLYDNVLPHAELASQVTSLEAQLAGVQIPVTVSELAYGYQERGAQDVLNAIDYINIHMLPFFSPNATTGAQAWPLDVTDMDWFIQNGNGKKMYFDEVEHFTMSWLFLLSITRLRMDGPLSRLQVFSPTARTRSPVSAVNKYVARDRSLTLADGAICRNIIRCLTATVRISRRRPAAASGGLHTFTLIFKTLDTGSTT